LKGQEPTVLVICRNGPVFAVRSGMMNGTRLDLFASPSSSSGNSSLSQTLKALSFPPVISLSVAASAWPNASRIVQRRSDATQSAPPTGI
jgi:hypothetical protein